MEERAAYNCKNACIVSLSLDDTNDWESRLKNLAAEEIYKKTIEEKGVTAIHIDVPDFEMQMEQLMKNYKQAENIEN